MQTQYTSGDSNNGANMMALVYDNAGGNQANYAGTLVKTTTSETLYTVNFTTNSVQRYVNLQMRIYGHTGAGTLRMAAWFDAITLTTTSKELVKVVTPKSTISSEDSVFVENQDGSLSEIKWSALKLDVSSLSTPIIQARAGEAISTGDALTLERITAFQPKAFNYVAMGNIAANNRISQTIMGNGVGFTTLNLLLLKTGNPTDTTTFTIETDNAGSPSGTAVTNGTATLVGTAMTTSATDTTITFPGTVTLTSGVRYHIVWKRQNAADAVNYYQIGTMVFNIRFSTRNLYNASWGTPSTTLGVFLMKCNGIFFDIAVKATAEFSSLANVDGFAQAAYTLGQTALIYKGIVTLSGLTKDAFYSLSNTAGLISTTPGTIKSTVGQALTTTTLNFDPSVKNGFEENASFRIYSANTASFIRRFQFTDNGTFIFSYSHDSSTSSTYLIYKNGVQQVNIAPGGSLSNTYNISFAPGDIITLYAVRNSGAGMTITVSRTLPFLNMLDL